MALLTQRGLGTGPTSLLSLSLLRFIDSKLPGDSLMEIRIPPLELRIPIESNPPKSRS